MIEQFKSELYQHPTQQESIALLAEYAKRETGAERCSIFLYQQEKDQLKSIYADGIKGSIVLNSNVGIVGYAFHKKISIIENHTGKSNIFFKNVDTKTSYNTETILAIPLLKENKRVGVLELLNKERGFTEADKNTIERYRDILLDILLPPQPTPTHTKVQTASIEEQFDSYLDSRKLYLMEDGSAYYKILNMKREYFIPADKCYLLTQTRDTIDIFYYTTDDDFLSLPMLVKLDKNAQDILISENIHKEIFLPYTLEEDQDTL